jgi:hypothetical protein
MCAICIAVACVCDRLRGTVGLEVPLNCPLSYVVRRRSWLHQSGRDPMSLVICSFFFFLFFWNQHFYTAASKQKVLRHGGPTNVKPVGMCVSTL